MSVMQKALRALPHLRSFQWFSWMDIPQGIQDTLESDIPNLPELRIFEYVSCPASHAVAHRLESPQVLHTLDLRQLRSLSCLVPRDMIDLEEPARDTCCTLDLVTANLNTLQELALDGILSLPWNLPVRTFENLKDLTLVALRDLHGLELVLRHSSNLESFIVENTRDDQLFSILAQNASSIPLLSSLKIISSGDWFHEESHYLALSMFLQDRQHMRRLDIHMIAPIQVVMIILPTLLSFKRLSALGLSLTSSAFPGMPVDYTSLPQFLSDSLEAVRFRVFLEEAMERLATLPSLRYLSLQKDGPGELWPLAAEVGSSLKHLNCLNLDQSLWFIVRSSPPEELASTWLPHKHILRLREDFAYQDAEWLARFVV
ncbi:hypothetical protein HWV62_20025 [Athelia sp. TMB]|nr:hypothetical protein HWV62_20025 [Athelia sp. TMB]